MKQLFAGSNPMGINDWEYLKTPYKDGGVYATIDGVEYYTLSNVLPTWAQYGTFSGEFQWQKKSSPPYTP